MALGGGHLFALDKAGMLNADSWDATMGGKADVKARELDWTQWDPSKVILVTNKGDFTSTVKRHVIASKLDYVCSHEVVVFGAWNQHLSPQDYIHWKR